MNKHSMEQIRRCLSDWSYRRGIGYMNGKLVYIQDLNDEQIFAVFTEYIKQIKTGKLAMPEHWKQAFLKVEEDAIESTIFDC